ncbi:MAG TPA: tRNA pseudouridine(38-40) synthase TruA [Longimicrobiales bacterium]
MEPPATRRIRLTLHYDGADFHGWQVQRGVRTVQQELEAALERLTTQPIRVAAAGRTDTGVHATGQVVSFDVPERWQAADLKRALNAVLPGDVWVEAAAEAAPDFHARFSASDRAYEYRLGLDGRAASPFHRRTCWVMRDRLDPLLLDRAANLLLGEHSFRAFAHAGQEERGDRCIVYESKWWEWAPLGVVYRVRANRFLHHMVRYLVGTMVDVARGRRPLEDVASLLSGAAGVETSPPAPPHGLFLVRVGYERRESSGRS